MLRFSAPLPVLLLLKSVVVLAVYGAAVPFRDGLASVGLTPLSLAVAFGFLSAFMRDMEAFFETDKSGIDPARLLTILLVLGISVSAFALFSPSDRVLQHAISVVLTLKAAVFTAFALWDPKSLQRVRWVARDWASGQHLAVAWFVLRLLALVTCYELMIEYGTELDWILAFALAPIAFYYLMLMGIAATWPRDDAR